MNGAAEFAQLCNLFATRKPGENSPRRRHITQKVRIGGQRAFYLSVVDGARPAKLCLRVDAPDRTAEIIGLYGVIVGLTSGPLQYGFRIEPLDDLFAGAKFESRGPVAGHDRIRCRSSLPGLIGSSPYGEYCGRGDLAHVLISGVGRLPAPNRGHLEAHSGT